MNKNFKSVMKVILYLTLNELFFLVKYFIIPVSLFLLPFSLRSTYPTCLIYVTSLSTNNSKKQYVYSIIFNIQ